jgi:hypothetical protein
LNKQNFYIFLFLCLCVLLKAQVIFLNNPSAHLVAFNPAFSAIQFGNSNYIPNQAGISARVSNDQWDVLSSGQTFFSKRNIGVSAHYNVADQSGSRFQKAGLGLSYHLLFFNGISTGWALGLSFTDLNATSASPFKVYGKTNGLFLRSSAYAMLNFGWMISYDRFMAGVSIQPRYALYTNNINTGTTYATGTAYAKYRYPMARNLNAMLWYAGNWNAIDNLRTFNSDIAHTKLHSHALHIHLSGKRGWIGGIGTRVTSFCYTSGIVKLGYNSKLLQVLYGIEPYRIYGTYSGMIHELGITLKFN